MAGHDGAGRDSPFDGPGSGPGSGPGGSGIDIGGRGGGLDDSDVSESESSGSEGSGDSEGSFVVSGSF